MGPTASNGFVVVGSPQGCPQWQASSPASWVTITSGMTGTGSGTVGFSVEANDGPPRSTTLSIAGQSFLVNQLTGCAFGITPSRPTVSAAGGSGTIDLMRTLIRENGTSVLFITHSLGLVAENCDEVATMYSGEIVEYGTVEQVFGKALHPYTQGLFGSLPDLSTATDRLKPIPGLMPDPTALPEGCFFCPRCPHAMDICAAEHPADVDLGGHRVKCHLYAAAGAAKGAAKTGSAAVATEGRAK